jgi:hypothetical protein
LASLRDMVKPDRFLTLASLSNSGIHQI